MRDVESSLVISIVLVVAVVFVFLRSGRATAIPSVVVPLSLIATFGAMFLLGFNLDNLSLMALTIATGFVVDDAIVVAENVARHLESGQSPRSAALAGARQIGFTIVSITASLLAAFIPLLFMDGVLGRLFREFAITILSTIPSAGLGARLALLLFKSDLNLIAIIGLILLIGIVMKNAILMIDFALELERHGKTAIEAMHQACLLRFRPIVMTTLAAMFGALPLALGSGTGSELRRPLGIAIVGGLLVSQILTLFTTPVTYVVLHDLARLLRSLTGRHEITATMVRR